MRAPHLALLLAAAAAAAAGCGHQPPEEKSDWERSHAAQLVPSDGDVVLPGYPRERELIQFSAGAASEFRFFVDSASLSVERDVVRYVLVARSSAGVENVSFEGMRCATAEVRIYAVGRAGEWSGKPGPWRAIAPGAQSWHSALYREYFCPYREPIASAREGVDSLRRGGAR